MDSIIRKYSLQEVLERIFLLYSEEVSELKQRGLRNKQKQTPAGSYLLKYDMIKGILTALNQMELRRKKVLLARFGVLENKTKTLQEVAEDLGVTRERVRQIEAKGIRELLYKSKASVAS